MTSQFVEQLTHFTGQVVATATALLAAATLIFGLRRFGWHGPTDPLGLIERLIARAREGPDSVNVEYRDANDERLDLGALVSVTLRNGRGRPAALRGGTFIGCDARHIQVGALVHISVQDDLVCERQTVQLDLNGQALVVRSEFSKQALIAEINRGRTP